MPIPDLSPNLIPLFLPPSKRPGFASILLGQRHEGNQAAWKTFQRLMAGDQIGLNAVSGIHKAFCDHANIPNEHRKQLDPKHIWKLDLLGKTGWQAGLVGIDQTLRLRILPFSFSEIERLDRQRLGWQSQLHWPPETLSSLCRDLPFLENDSPLRDSDFWIRLSGSKDATNWLGALIALYSIAYTLACFDAEMASHELGYSSYISNLMKSISDNESNLSPINVWLDSLPKSQHEKPDDWLKNHFSGDPDSDRQQRWRLIKGERIGFEKAVKVCALGYTPEEDIVGGMIRYFMMNLACNLAETERTLMHHLATGETPITNVFYHASDIANGRNSLPGDYPRILKTATANLAGFHKNTHHQAAE